MNKLIASACAVAALSFGAPASAQSGILGDIVQGVFGGRSSGRISNFDDNIRVAYQRGEISDREARDLQKRYYKLREREDKYRRNGLTQHERYDLQNRANELQRRLDQARYDGDGRYNRDWDNDYRGGDYAYRDTDRYVWQQDRNGRMIQIDRRTGEVVRVVNR